MSCGANEWLDMSPEYRHKIHVYENRRFTDSFHVFTTRLCLAEDPHKRFVSVDVSNMWLLCQYDT